MLTPNDLDEIVQVALKAGLETNAKRRLLLAWVSPDIVSRLPVHAIPLDQLRSDVIELFKLEKNGIPSLRIWLESAARHAQGRPSAVATFTSARRALDQPTTPAKAKATASPRLGIVFVAAQPKTGEHLRIGQELRDIRDRLQSSLMRDRIEVSDIQTAAQAKHLQEIVRRGKGQLLHLSMHGKEGGTLVFEGQTGESHEVDPQLFSQLLGLVNRGREDPYRWVLINACHSSELAKVLTAQDTGVRAAIGTTNTVKDGSAIAFAEGFYSALVDQMSLENAFEAGKVQIALLGPTHTVDVSRYVLHTREDADAKAYVLPK